MSEENWERLRRINRKYNEIKVSIFGLKKDFNILLDNQIPIDGDKKYVLQFLKKEYPEYIVSMDWNSDLLDDFHPISRNAFAFMAIRFKALKNKEDKATIVYKFMDEIRDKKQMYVEHL